jgi:hypothetical protein
MDSLTIFHPYGSLGQLDFSDGRGGVPWGPQPEDAQHTKETLRVYTEDSGEDNPITQNVLEKITRAKKFVFWGFGFHKQNMNLLNVRHEAQEFDAELRQVYASFTMLSSPQIDAIKGVIGESIHTNPNRNEHFKYGTRNQDCAELLVRHEGLIVG